jgi:hypothetical protein
MKKIYWILIIPLSLLITGFAAYYQRVTGPTYPKKISIIISGANYNLQLIRTHSSTSDAEIVLPIADEQIEGSVIYKKYPTNDAWDTLKMERKSSGLVASLPKQAPAGKLEYFIHLTFPTGETSVMQDEPIIIRYKGDVPMHILIPHIILMFLGMLLANLSGLSAAFRFKTSRIFMWITFFLFLIGGMIYGPFVQKFAFDAYWTGIPFGWDLTDNKTLIAFLAWTIAILTNLKKFRPRYIIIAAVVTLIIFLIPHSMFGSQLNHATGNVNTGV